MKDVQNQSDNRGVDIQKVGIKGIELPLVIQRKDKEDIVIYSNANEFISSSASDCGGCIYNEANFLDSGSRIYGCWKA